MAQSQRRIEWTEEDSGSIMPLTDEGKGTDVCHRVSTGDQSHRDHRVPFFLPTSGETGSRSGSRRAFGQLAALDRNFSQALDVEPVVTGQERTPGRLLAKPLEFVGEELHERQQQRVGALKDGGIGMVEKGMGGVGIAAKDGEVLLTEREEPVDDRLDLLLLGRLELCPEASPGLSIGRNLVVGGRGMVILQPIEMGFF